MSVVTGEGIPAPYLVARDFYEYVEGTDLVDPGSIFLLSDCSLVADSAVMLSWWSVAGRTYAV